MATRGDGAWWMAGREETLTPIHVSCRRELSEARVLRSWEDRHGDVARLQRILEGCGYHTSVIRMDSQAKYAAVARGDASIYLRLPNPKTPDYREKIWDHAAGALVVEEAGGRVTDVHGQPLDFSAGAKLERNRGVIASNGAGHDEVVATLEAMRGA